jgi:hypothetical protein
MRRTFFTVTLAALLACKFASEGVGDASTVSPGAEESSADEGAPTSGTGDELTGESAETSDPASCGDGVRDPGEACDDGAGNGSDRACTPECAVNTCGDGYALAGVEACDDGDDDDDDECVGCQAAVCGDGAVYKNVESCDGAGESPDCDADCSVASCGDGTINAAAGELCDLGAGNGVYGGECNAACDGPGPTCGDGEIDEPDEICDPAKSPPPQQLCINQCKVLVCDKGWGDCDGDPVNGCEIDHENDEERCGDCETDCGFFSCKNGHCGI